MDKEQKSRRGKGGRRNQKLEMTTLAGSTEDSSSLEDEPLSHEYVNRRQDQDFSEDSDDDSHGERTGFLRTFPLAEGPKRRRGRRPKRNVMTAPSDEEDFEESWLYKTLLPDTGLSIRGHVLLEANGFATKLLKFILWTFLSIALVHVIVAHLFDDRDQWLKIAHIWRYESDLIVRDCVIFFVVGRLWEKPGIDHVAWMVTAMLSNVYFESQNFVWFLQHSVTLFQMHCIWPWELWLFALVLVVAASGLVAAHVRKAWKERLVLAKLTEVGLCILFFMAPVITSDYFHLHHWYAGWLMGMQFNFDEWWSRMAMAWCWGMYVNGIAVYGRDPVLTCEYAYFLSLDNRCPYISCYVQGIADVNNTEVTEMVPVDWRNCSATDAFQP